MAHDAPKQDAIDANVPMTTSGTPTEWEQRRRLVQAIMDSLRQLMEQMDHTAAPGCYSLRRILVETGVTLDMIRARVAHQAFAGGPPEAFWPPMRALLDSFFPELGSLVCESLEMDRAYEAFWEPETRALMREMSNATPEPESFLNVVAHFLSAGRQVEAEGDQVVFTPSSRPLTAAQCHFLDCAEALSHTLAQVFEEAVARGDVPTGPCWVCGAPATDQCDYGYNTGHTCNRWICDAHLVIEAQAWDIHGWEAWTSAARRTGISPSTRMTSCEGMGCLLPLAGKGTTPGCCSFIKRHSIRGRRRARLPTLEETTMQHAWRLSRKDAARVKWLLAQPKPCLLCNTFPMAYNGIFQPTKPEIWGGKPGKGRQLGYALCAPSAPPCQT